MGGGNNGKKTIFSAEGLSQADVLDIGRSRCNSNNGEQYPGIAVDINWAVYQRMKLAGGPVAATCELLLDWASKGAVMWPICDGDTRPVSKQATNKSNAKRKKGHNKATIARVELRKINEAINHGGLDEEALGKAVEQRTKLQKDIKAGESQSTKQVPNNFPQLLADMLARLSAHQLSESNGTVKEVLTAEFQADGLMGGLYEEGKVQLIMTGDIDIPIIFGDRCISITKCTGKTFSISSTCKKALTDAISCLPLTRQQKIKFHNPLWPIYSGVCDRRLRVLMMVIIESDVCPGGVYGAGPDWVQNAMKAISESDSVESVYEQLIDRATAKDKRFTAKLLNTYVDAVVYEPVNECGGKRKYMDGSPPETLPSYLEEFQSNSTEIDAGPAVLECKCTGVDARHKFLEAVEHHCCTECKETTCKHCTDFVNKQPYCLECYLVKNILPGVEVNDLKSIHQMSSELIERYNFKKADVEKLMPDEVEKIWSEQSLQRSLEEMADKVEFPLLPSSAIHSKDGEIWKVITEVDLGFGGAFINNPDIPPKRMPQILELLAAFVLFDKPGKKYTAWQKDGSVFSAMPKMFIDFATKCRVDMGYRLLERCVRHAMDNRTEPLDANEKHLMKLVVYKDQVGIAINAPMPASMKGDVYDGWTVITIDSLLCAECDCKSGSKENDKVACVHTLARAYLLSILLCEDLAEHILVELCSLVSAGDVERKVWNDDEIVLMKKSMIVLAEATGNMELAEAMSKQSTMYAMLESFQTGTQKSNEWKRARGKPSPDEILPLTKMNLDSAVYKAKLKMHKVSPKKSTDPTEPIRTFVPDYSTVCAACNAVGISPSKIPFVGHQLLVHRRNILQEDSDVQAAKMLEMQPKWKLLMEEAESRSKRVPDASLSNLTKRRKSNVTTTPLRRSGRVCSSKEGEQRPKKKRLYKSPGYKCCAKLGCSNHSQMEGITMHRIPPMPPPLDSPATKKQIIKWRKKVEIHLEFMDRCGYGRDGTTSADLRVCSAHEKVKHTTRQIKYKHSGITISESFSFDVISGAGENSSLLPSTATKGVASTRAVARILNDVQEKAKKATSPVTVPPTTENKLQRERRLREEAEGNAAEMVMVTQQVVECHSIEESPVPINPVVARIAGIVTPQPKVPPRKRKFNTHDTSTALNKQQEKLTRISDLPPSVLPNIKDAEVKRRTGFETLSAMLAYIVVVTNGNFDLIRERRSSLTWFEEWFRYFEWAYGEVCRRQIDRESDWGIAARQVRAVIDLKGAIEVGALQSWPRFASFSEDKAIRDAAKWSKYDNDRIILWDMTNVTMPQYSDAGVQRTTFSQYYGENCLKAGVGIQLCGWLLVWDFWGGGITDDQYNNQSGYLQEQEKFANADLVDGKVVPFTNVKDRGYRTSFAAWKHGEQKVLQPPFAKSDKRFNGRQTIYAGSVARDRSGNERGVNVSKRSGMFQRGFQKTMNQKRFNYAWLTWSFKANFMYKRVL